MHVFYAGDNNFAWLMGISAISLFENNKRMKDLEVWFLTSDISDENRKKLNDVENKYGRNINILKLPDLNMPESLCSERWPQITFARLFAAEVLPENIDKALYIDCDTIVCGDISELESYDMGGNIFCGTRDCISKAYRKNIGLDENDLYINTGVMLIDIKKLRSMDIRPHLEETARKYKDVIFYSDQDLLNISFKGSIGEIPPKYDLMTISASYSADRIRKLRRPVMFYAENELEEARKDVRIIHYTTNMLTVRPWYENSNHPYAEEFTQYMAISPWEDKELAVMRFNKKEHKIIKIVSILPAPVSDRILGFLHSTLRPLIKRIRRGK